MRSIVIRTLVILIVVILQASFINLALPKNLIIDLLPLVVLAWVVIASFEKIWPWIVALGIFADLISFNKVGINVIFFIILAYAVSFFSRRFLIERRLAGFIFISLFIIATFFFLDIGRIFVVENFSIFDTYENIKKDLFSWNRIILQNILNIVFFYIVFFPLNKIEKNIESYENKVRPLS